MFLKTPEDYLKGRLGYIDNFLSRKDEFINSVLKNTSFHIGHYPDVNIENKERSDSDENLNIEEDTWSLADKYPLTNIRGLMVSNESYIDEKELKWIKKERYLWVVTNILFDIYSNYRERLSSVGIMNNTTKYSPVDMFSRNERKVKYDDVILFIDMVTILEGKEYILNTLSILHNKIFFLRKKYPKPFIFIRGKDEFDWLSQRLYKNKIITEIDVNYLFYNDGDDMILSCFDFWAINLDEEKIKLFLLETKKAISQRRFREKVKDKEVLNTYISKQAKRRLKYLAKKHTLNINEVLEIFILGNDKKTQSEKLIEALESTME